MRVLMVTTHVVFTTGESSQLQQCLRQALLADGHEVDTIDLPFTPECARLDQQVLALSCLDLSEAGGAPVDRLIALGYPAYAIPHPNKVAWLTKCLAESCAPWCESPVRGLDDAAADREKQHVVLRADTRFLRECRRVFVASNALETVLGRLNGLAPDGVLYPPLLCSESETGGTVGDYFVCPIDGVVEEDLRMIMDAMRGIAGKFKLVLFGAQDSPRAAELRALVQTSHGAARVEVQQETTRRDEVRLISNARGLILATRDEPVCGQRLLAAMRARTPTLALTWVGAPLELLRDGENALIVEPRQDDVSRALQRLTARDVATRLGTAANATLDRRGIDWATVSRTLLS
ncbi:MAG TPA: glycosyltransferase [Chloroflexota bacterium]|nr:glycosyltransferase [Chloroflexota bacterium]